MSYREKKGLDPTIVAALIGTIGTILVTLITLYSDRLIAPISTPTPGFIVVTTTVVGVSQTPTAQPSLTNTSKPAITPSKINTPAPTVTPTRTNTPTPVIVPSKTNTPSSIALLESPIVIVSVFLASLPIMYVGILYSVRYRRKVIADRRARFIRFSNPYNAGLPISSPQMFFGRSNIVEMVHREIKEPKQKPPLLIYGRRRMGKTSALLNLGRLVSDNRIVDIYIDAQDIKYRTDVGLAYNLIHTVMLKLKKELSTKKLFADEEKYLVEKNYQENAVLMLSNFFSDCNSILEENNLYCLLMFDEYELLGESISKDFFFQIRSTMQHKQQFVFLFSGAHMPNELPSDNWKEVFMNVKTLRISFLEREDGYDLLTKPVPTLEYSSERLIHQILDMTGCQPLLLQAIGAEIINQLNLERKRIVNTQIYKTALRKVVDAWSSNFFDHIWNVECDSNKDKELLVKIAKSNGKAKRSVLKNYESSLDKLSRRDLLKIENGYVSLTIPLVMHWLERENHL